MCEETVSSYGQVLTGDQHGIREKLGDLPSHQSLQIKLAQEPATIIVTFTTEENLQKCTPYASSTLLIVLKRPIVVQLYQRRGAPLLPLDFWTKSLPAGIVFSPEHH